ncbi:alpha/beta hydrolase [Halobacterium sp. KA-4]|uniref:alpha/beta hydrolase n=1 Tax=Halobacterium sp. KA-4 TaxID=2896367 RepID=UPI001E2A80F5|nr:alpha/beta hydrolase [Halobacterium sp. KA-4]MCD2201702.1 alpha/beta hydrolase [Halobacterium sp. KA-4]
MRAQDPHPELQAFIDQSADDPAFHELTVEDARAITNDVFTVDDPEPVETVEDHTIEGPGGDLSVRVYAPESDGDLGVTMFFHGGGFISGSLESHDQLCRVLAKTAGIAVVAVDYRLAPEHPFPAAPKDAYAATEWVAENASEFGGDADRLAVAGDSAGGNLAAVVAQMARDRGGPELVYQGLAYPTVSPDDDWESIKENGEGYFITKEDLAWFDDHYFVDDIDTRNIYGYPLLAADLEDLPPATVVTGGFDPLRDEGVAYAERLAGAGVSVEHRHYDDAIHAFLQLAPEPFEFERSREAFDDLASDLADALTE